MSETEKLLNFYKSFYYRVWDSGYISSDVAYELAEDTRNALGYSNNDIDSLEVEKELENLDVR